MRDRHLWSKWRPVAAALVALVMVTESAWGQPSSTSSSKDQSNKDQSKNTEPVVRTFGAEGGYRTEVTTQVNGKELAEEEWRQASLLMAQVFQHIDKACDAIDAGELYVETGLASMAAVNAFGGFLVTQRMLEMFKKKEPKTAAPEKK